MSVKINIDSIDDLLREKIHKDLSLKIEINSYGAQKKYKTIYPYHTVSIENNGVNSEYAYLPFAYSVSIGLKRPIRNVFPKANINFISELREEQKELRSEAESHLNNCGSTIISAYTGFGKSITAINMASRIKLKTLIVLNRLILMKQWEDSINTFCSNTIKVQCIKPKAIKKDCEFYIMNATNIPKMGADFFNDIGFIIIDEIHLIVAEKLSECLQYLTPRYMIGLSATPNRQDGLNCLFNLYCGNSRVFRKLNREHIAYKVKTNFEPIVELASNGKINWNTVLESQSNDVNRNELIIKIVKFFQDRVFLIICKRISQANYILDRLLEEKEDVTGLFGSRMTYTQSSRILVGTTGKCSTGFDHPRLNTLLLASDVEAYYQQVLGRCMRTKEGIPIIFDLVDNNNILDKHWRTRRAIYLEHGGIIKDFKKEFPNF